MNNNIIDLFPNHNIKAENETKNKTENDNNVEGYQDLYKEIESCIEGITQEMIDMLNEDEFSALAGDDLRKKNLLKLYYRGLIKKPLIIIPIPDYSGKIHFDLINYKDYKILNLKDQLRSSKFSNIKDLHTRLVPIDKYFNSLNNSEGNSELPSEFKRGINYHEVDISQNVLLDDDLECIFNFTLKNKINILNLSGNRFYCDSKKDLDLLWKILDNVELLVICQCHDILLSNTLFLKELSIDRAKKIILLSSTFSKKSHFQKCLPCLDPEIYSILHYTHDYYYKFKLF